MAKILILTDGKAGHENQSKAFARALGCDFDLCTVRFRSKFHKVLSYLFDRCGVRSSGLFRLERPCAAAANYRAVIGAGSGTFYAVKTVARTLGVKCGVVLYPRGYRLSGFDCVLAPTFDRPKHAANIIEIPANLVANDEAFYRKGVADFQSHYLKTVGRAPSCESGAAVAVIVGGPNTCSTMSADWMRHQLEAIFAANPSVTEFWVTTSRRTPPDVEAVVDSFPWTYRLLYSRDRFNPIPAFVQLAKRLYVTAESTGMLSEACTFGCAEVVALDNLLPGPHKFRRFVELLRTGGYVDGTRKVDLSAQFAAAKARLEI